jgi:uncharacterized coiled-coil protein SlyX
MVMLRRVRCTKHDDTHLGASLECDTFERGYERGRASLADLEMQITLHEGTITRLESQLGTHDVEMARLREALEAAVKRAGPHADECSATRDMVRILGDALAATGAKPKTSETDALASSSGATTPTPRPGGGSEEPGTSPRVARDGEVVVLPSSPRAEPDDLMLPLPEIRNAGRCLTYEQIEQLKAAASAETVRAVCEWLRTPSVGASGVADAILAGAWKKGGRNGSL